MKTTSPQPKPHRAQEGFLTFRSLLGHLVTLVLVLFINPIGASGVGPGAIPGTNPSTTPFTLTLVQSSLVTLVTLVFRFWMVFIGTPRSETNMGGGDQIVLRSKPNYLRLQHTWSIMSSKIEVEMVIGRVVIPRFSSASYE